MATNGRRRTKGAGSIIHRKDGSWEFRREVGRDPATGKRRYVSAKGRTKAGARERFDARIAEMERTGLLPGAKSPYLKDYAERWLEEYRLNVKPTTYRTRAGRIHACMEVIGCVRLTDLTPDHVRQCMRVLSKRLAVYGQINVYGVTTKSERHKRSYWTRTADGNGIGGRKAPVPYGS